MKNENMTVEGLLRDIYRAPARTRNAALLAAHRALENKPTALLTTQAEASRLIGVSRYTFWRWVRAGVIQPVMVRGVPRYRVTDLERLAAEGAPQPAPAQPSREASV